MSDNMGSLPPDALPTHQTPTNQSLATPHAQQQIPAVQDAVAIQQLLHALTVAAGTYAPTVQVPGYQQNDVAALMNLHHSQQISTPSFPALHPYAWGRQPIYQSPYGSMQGAHVPYGSMLTNPIPQPSTSQPTAAEEDPKHARQPFNTAEEKRRRNTEASARFRVKKKMRAYNLQKTVDDLAGRAEELEKEATDLRKENGWLKEIIMLKGRSDGPADPAPADTGKKQAEKQRRRRRRSKHDESTSGSDTEVESTSKRKDKQKARSSR